VSDSIRLFGVDGNVVDHPEKLPDAEILARRGCYCDQWQSEEGRMQPHSEGIPEGFCGRCIACGEPGHMSHYPGAFAFTGSWCDKHYIEEARTKKMMGGKRSGPV
jgi:hypothetical protein